MKRRSDSISRALIARARHASFVAFAGACSALAAPAQEKSELARPPLELFDERPFENDSFVPVSRAAEEALARGDRVWIEISRANPSAELPAETLDRWREALALSAPGELVRAALGDARDEKLPWPPDPRGEREHRYVGVERALVERFLATAPLQDVPAPAGSKEAPTRMRAPPLAAYEAWRKRFDALAEVAAREAGGDERALEKLAREFPWTRAAAQAELKLADLAFERGSSATADERLRRASAQLAGREGADGDALRAALQARTSALHPPQLPSNPSVFARANKLEPSMRFPLEAWSSGVRRVERTRVYAGIASSSDGSIVIQTPRELVRILAGKAARIALEPELARARATPPEPFADRASDWVHAPADDGDMAVLVVGRTNDESDNALLALDVKLGRARWCWSGNGVWREGGAAADPTNLLGGGRLEFEPGPILFGELVWVHVRAWPSSGSAEPARPSPARFESWWCALDRRTGELRARTLLGRGASPVASLEKPNLGIRVPTPQAPAAVRDDGSPQAWVDTGLGLLAEVCLLDGRVQTVRAASRVRADEPYRGTASGTLVASHPLASDARIWAPADSPFVHACASAPAGARHLARSAGAWLIRAGRCIAFGPDSTPFLLRSGGDGWEFPASALHAATRSFDPGRAEPPLPVVGLLRDAQLVSTESALYLLDGSTLAVRDRAPLDAGEAGALYTEGPFDAPFATAWVVGERALSTFRIAD